MSRLSRIQQLPRWVAAIAILAFVVFAAFSIYIFILNRRLTHELVSHSWRAPTNIISAAHPTAVPVATLYGLDWRTTPPVTLGSMPDYVSRAFLAAEDVRFHHHLGIDPIGIVRALFANIRARGIAAGGSTIDQQIIKTRFLTQERTWRRKFTEIILAVLLDARMTKNEILEIYLNDIYLGHSGGRPILGIEEASRIYFDKRPSQLRLDEAAVLAGMIRAPNRDTPEKRPDIVRARRDAILDVMREHDWINDTQLAAAKRRSVDFSGGEVTRAPYPFYLRALRADIVKEIGVSPIIEGGLTIVCEMDPDAQRNAERVASRVPEQLESAHAWLRAQARTEPLQVALLSIDPRNGGVRALVGGSDFDRSPFDRTSAMHRQPGSAFKTFAYLAAIASKKATTASLLLDGPLSIAVSGRENWQPHNYDGRYRGRVTLRESFEHSLNVPTVRLTEEIGVARVADTAEAFGFEEKFPHIPALPLGVTEVSMRELTAAYTPFPNLGIRVEPFLLREVRNRVGKTLYLHQLVQKRVAKADATYVLHTLLRGVVQRGTASRLSRYGLGYVAGKTGTTSDYRDAWFVGYVPDMVTSVWVGFDHGAPLRLSSGEAAIPIWGAYMSSIPHLHSEPRAPAGVTFREIDSETGMLWQDGCPPPIQEVFLSGTAPTHKCPAGFFGRIVRRVFFSSDNFDEPAAISLEEFRKWANDVDKSRRDVEGVWGRLRKIFH